MRRFAAFVFGPLLAIYMLTMQTAQPYNIDAATNALTAWSIGVRGTPLLDDLFESDDLPRFWERLYWLSEGTTGHIASKYPPGAPLLASPLYAAIRADAPVRTVTPTNPPQTPERVPLPPLWPASATASVSTALAMTFLGLGFRDFLSDRQALVGAWIAGLGTTAWAVASAELWQHGPAMMWIALGIYLAQHEKLASSGAAFGLAVLTRPQVAAIPAIAGALAAWRRRSVRTLFLFGAPALAGAALYALYNRAVFGAWLPTDAGGYFVDRAADIGVADTVIAVIRSAVDPGRGFLVWSPFLIILLPGLGKAWAHSPSWVRGFALGGVLFLFVQMRGNIWTGGEGHPGYRYPLEALTAAAPLLALSYRHWVSPRPIRVRLFLAAVTISILGEVAGSVLRQGGRM